MSRSNQQRRANRKRLNSQRRHQHGSTSGAPDEPIAHLDVRALVLLAARYSADAGLPKGFFQDVVQQLANLEAVPDLLLRPSHTIHNELVGVTSKLYEAGWQPADVVHLVKRECTARASRLAVEVIAGEARTSRAMARAPHLWLSQLEDVGAYDPARGLILGGHANALTAWSKAEKLHPDEALGSALQVLAVLLRAPRQTLLVGPPSAWGASNRGVMPARNVSGPVDAKALKLIRALLAKAEGTTFDAEADAFTAKAQAMMTRYSIDAAVVASVGSDSPDRGVEARRVHIDGPYADEKAGFLAVLAEVNGARCVWSPQVGSSTLMGFPVDLQLIELLFTSLLVQATQAATSATANNREMRTPSFRRAFLVAFADRIGERLSEGKSNASAQAAEHYGDSLLPILVSRDEAVLTAFEQAFPDVTTMRSRRLNANGWYAGRAAADVAQIGRATPIAAQ